MTTLPDSEVEVMYDVKGGLRRDELQKLGRYRWRGTRKRSIWSRLEAFIFPVGLLYFMISFMAPASGGTRMLLMLPLAPMLGWLIWMTYRDWKASDRAGESFVSTHGVRRNGRQKV